MCCSVSNNCDVQCSMFRYSYMYVELKSKLRKFIIDKEFLFEIIRRKWFSQFSHSQFLSFYYYNLLKQVCHHSFASIRERERDEKKFHISICDVNWNPKCVFPCNKHINSNWMIKYRVFSSSFYFFFSFSISSIYILEYE